MKNLVTFFHNLGKLKEMPRNGWIIRDIKNPESIADHIFRASLMAWVLGNEKKKLNIERILKMALMHDICEIYAGDITPYDSVLPKNRKARREFMKTVPRFTEAEKLKISRAKHKKEKEGLNKLIKDLSPNLRSEMKNLWLDFEKGLTPEGRFFRQADKLEAFLQSLEYWKKFKKPPQGPWWQRAREFFDDPHLLEFIEEMDKEFHKKSKPRV